MPSSHYRRKLRNQLSNSGYTNYTKSSENSELIRLQERFYYVLDSIINHNDFTTITSSLQNIINTVKSTIDYYKIIDIIENNLLSVVFNITNSVNPELIKTRIDYIKTYINSLPPMCQDCGQVPVLLFDLLDSIIKGVDFSVINKNIQEIQTYINDKYGNNDKIELVQENLLKIVCNISDGTNSELIAYRIQYIRTLISQI
jgi:hypothetical protein